MLHHVMQQPALEFKAMLQDDIDLNSRKCCIRTTECGDFIRKPTSIYLFIISYNSISSTVSLNNCKDLIKINIHYNYSMYANNGPPVKIKGPHCGPTLAVVCLCWLSCAYVSRRWPTLAVEDLR